MKIIRKLGIKRTFYNTSCEFCNCEFLFQIQDTRIGHFNSILVSCPCCGTECDVVFDLEKQGWDDVKTEDDYRTDAQLYGKNIYLGE